MTMRNIRIILFSLCGIALTGLAIVLVYRISRAPTPFNGQRAYQDVLAQVAFGPRITGSQAHAETIRYIEAEAQKSRLEYSDTGNHLAGLPC